jgi:glycosyltransferase involved in cell wall biosynthesis
MRLAFVTVMAGSPWGACEELWAAAARSALAAGHEVAVSVYRWARRTPQLQALEQAGARLFVRPTPRLTRLHNLRLRVMRPFRWLHRFAPDAVCVSQGATFDVCSLADGCQLSEYLLGTATPFVLVCHGNHEAVLPPEFVRQRALLLFPAAHRVAFVAQRNAAIAERHLAASLPNAVVVRNPLLLPSLEPVAWPTAATPRFALVARVVPAVKGHDAILEALAGVAWRDRDWRLNIYGEGEVDYLRRLVVHYRLVGRVEFVGHTSDIRGVWAAHHLALLPSRTESAPLSLVEAMVCGRPVLATDVGGVREWLTDGRSGYLAEACSVHALQRHLERAWQEQERWPVLGAVARTEALARLDPDPGGSLVRLLEQAAGREYRAAG